MNKFLKFELHHLYIPVSVLVCILLVIFRSQAKIQFGLLGGAALVYLGFTFLHHLKDKSLTIEVALEYILIAALSLIILQQFLQA